LLNLSWPATTADSTATATIADGRLRPGALHDDYPLVFIVKQILERISGHYMQT